MIEPITITAKKLTLDDTIKKYTVKKIGRLDRFLPRHARKSASAEVILKQIDHPHGNKYEVEAVLTALDQTFVAKDSTVNVLAAVDIVEAKLNGQIRKYKTQQMKRTKRSGRLFGRSSAQTAEAEAEAQ